MAARARYTTDRVAARRLALATGALALVIVLVLVASLALVTAGRSPERQRLAASRSTPPAIAGPVRLEPDPAAAIAAYRAEKARLLNGYAWVDRTRGIVRIPIDEAMARLAQGGAGAQGTR